MLPPKNHSNAENTKRISPISTGVDKIHA